MAISTNIPPEILRYEISDDMTVVKFFQFNEYVYQIENLDQTLPVFDMASVQALAEQHLLSLYEQNLKPGMIREVENIYKSRAKSKPYVHTDGTKWPMRFKTTTIFKSVIDMANMLGDTTVDFVDIEDVPHTYTLADATTLMLSMGGALRALYQEKNVTITSIRADTDGTGYLAYKAYVDKYNPVMVP